MKSIRAVRGSLVALTLAGCASLQVRSDFDDQVSFQRLATYAWVDSGPAGTGHPALGGGIVERRLRAAVDAQLLSKGYRNVTSGTPDFRIRYQVVAEPRSTVYQSYGYSPYYGRRFGRGRYGRYGGYGGYGGYGSGYVREFLEGTVILDIIDAGNDELIWRGWAKGELAANPKPDEVHEYIAKAVGKILDDFPPEGAEALAALAP